MPQTITKPAPVTDADTALTPKTAEVLAEYSASHRRIEIAAIVAFFSLTVFLVWRMSAFERPSQLWLIGAAAFLGYVAADFASGLVHWGFDTWGSIHTPFLGKNFIRPFREHHFDEKAMTKHDFVETNGNNCLVSLPILVGACFIPNTSSFGLFALTFVVSTCVAVMATNQIHKWSHQDEPPALITALQKAHLILPPDHHQVHHTKPHDSYYCITTGWLNSSLLAVNFFRIAERVVTATTGAHPRRDDLS
jgi:hypothetical protein